MRLMQENRRNVKGYGCITDLSGDLSNLRLKESRIKEMCWWNAIMVSILDLSFRGDFERGSDP